MTVEQMLWAVLGAIGVVGGLGLLLALWSLIKAPKEH